MRGATLGNISGDAGEGASRIGGANHKTPPFVPNEVEERR